MRHLLIMLATAGNLPSCDPMTKVDDRGYVTGYKVAGKTCLEGSEYNIIDVPTGGYSLQRREVAEKRVPC